MPMSKSTSNIPLKIYSTVYSVYYWSIFYILLRGKRVLGCRLYSMCNRESKYWHANHDFRDERAGFWNVLKLHYQWLGGGEMMTSYVWISNRNHIIITKDNFLPIPLIIIHLSSNEPEKNGKKKENLSSTQAHFEKKMCTFSKKRCALYEWLSWRLLLLYLKYLKFEIKFNWKLILTNYELWALPSSAIASICTYKMH